MNVINFFDPFRQDIDKSNSPFEEACNSGIWRFSWESWDQRIWFNGNNSSEGVASLFIVKGYVQLDLTHTMPALVTNDAACVVKMDAGEAEVQERRLVAQPEFTLNIEQVIR